MEKKMSELHAIAHKMVEKGKGILAADESTPHVKKDLIVFQLNQLRVQEIIIEIFYLPQRELKSL